jgi:hypothetical protein
MANLEPQARLVPGMHPTTAIDGALGDVAVGEFTEPVVVRNAVAILRRDAPPHPTVSSAVPHER